MATCRSPHCRADIIFAWTGRRSMPVDPEPHPDGNVRLTRFDDPSRPGGARFEATTLGPLEVQLAREAGEQLYLSHFVTCPDAGEFR